MSTLSISEWFSNLWNSIKNLFWQGDYWFFSYKGHINYNGEDYNGAPKQMYLWFTFISIFLLCFFLRKTKKESVEKYMKVLAIIMPVLEISKVTWESYWDIDIGNGFNWEGLIPIYTCSLFIYTMLFAAYGKGKVKEMCTTWVTTIGFVGGMSNVLFPRGLAWYPAFSFGCLYSLFFHYIMVFTAMFLVTTGYKTYKFSDIWEGFVPHLVFSCLVIPIDMIFGWDYMQYKDAGGVPIFEGIADKLQEAGLNILVPFMMLVVYFALHTVLLLVFKYTREGILWLSAKIKEKTRQENRS